MTTRADLDEQLEALHEQLRDALARRRELPTWKVDMPKEGRQVRYALAREMTELRAKIHEIGRPCPDEFCNGRVRTHRESYYDMDRCDNCRYSALVYKLGD